jgi:hypothetical protein
MYGEFVDDSSKWNSREQNTNRKIQLILQPQTSEFCLKGLLRTEVFRGKFGLRKKIFRNFFLLNFI